MSSNLPAITATDIDSAKALAASDLLPGHLRGKPANIVLIAAIARSLHLDPITALTQVAVVDGKPTLGASLQAALVRRAGHRLRVEVDDDNLTATATLVRTDDPDTEHTARWNEAKATRAGLWGKGAWAKYPGAMLANRAITEVVRMAASDVLMGAVYDEDELGGTPVEAVEDKVITVDGDQVDTATGEIVEVIDDDDVEVIEP